MKKLRAIALIEQFRVLWRELYDDAPVPELSYDRTHRAIRYSRDNPRRIDVRVPIWFFKEHFVGPLERAAQQQREHHT